MRKRIHDRERDEIAGRHATRSRRDRPTACTRSIWTFSSARRTRVFVMDHYTLPRL